MGMATLRRYKREQITKLEDVQPKKEEKKEEVKKPKTRKKAE